MRLISKRPRVFAFLLHRRSRSTLRNIRLAPLLRHYPTFRQGIAVLVSCLSDHPRRTTVKRCVTVPLSSLSPTVLKKMLCPDPKGRWGTDEILRDPWLAAVPVCGESALLRFRAVGITSIWCADGFPSPLPFFLPNRGRPTIRSQTHDRTPHIVK